MRDEQRLTMSALQVGSMVDAIDPAVHPVGTSKELRNVRFDRGTLDKRLGWMPMFITPLPCAGVINAKDGAYRDTNGRLHRLYVGDGGQLYHALGEHPVVWTRVLLHQDVAWAWDATYRATFAEWGDDLIIGFWQPPESIVTPATGAQCLRFDGTSDDMASTPGVANLTGPAAAALAADVNDLLSGMLAYDSAALGLQWETVSPVDPSGVMLAAIIAGGPPDDAVVTAANAALPGLLALVPGTVPTYLRDNMLSGTIRVGLVSGIINMAARITTLNGSSSLGIGERVVLLIEDILADAFANLTPTVGPFHAFGVSLPEPTVAPTAAITAGTGILFGIYEYGITFRDADTGWESDMGPTVTIDFARPEPPPTPPTLAIVTAGVPPLPVAGNVPVGTHGYAYCYRSTLAPTYRSPLSFPAHVTLDTAGQVTVSGLVASTEALMGIIEIYRTTGDVARFLANGTAGVPYTDNLASTSTTLYDEGSAAISVTGASLYAGGGSVANGRVVGRCIYRKDNGVGEFKRVSVALADFGNTNPTTPYTDSAETPLGDTWERSVAVPLMGVVAAGPDNRLLYLNDLGNRLPAQGYHSAGPTRPESLATTDIQDLDTTLTVGAAHDPITACENGNDGWLIGKRQTIHYLNRATGQVESVLSARGNVSPGTMQLIGNRLVMLTAEGPGWPDSSLPLGFHFCGPTANEFCLASTWEGVVKARLPYASSFHIPAKALVGWLVQRCATGSDNDTLILWQYSYDPPNGRVWIDDHPNMACLMKIPEAGSSLVTIEAVICVGSTSIPIILHHGEHPDGMLYNVFGTVTGGNGVLELAINSTLPDTAIGSMLWVTGGAGSRVGRDVLPCENVAAVITGMGSNRVYTQGVLAVAPGSEFLVGGFQRRWWPNFNVGNTQAFKKFVTGHLRTD